MVTVRVDDGEPVGFTAPTLCLVGRGGDCRVRLRVQRSNVSRHHCLLDIDPPHVRVLDLNSSNGTDVNGERLHGARWLRDGDRVRVGDAVLRVGGAEPRPDVAATVIGGARPGPGDTARDGQRWPRPAAPRTLPATRDGYRILCELGRGGYGTVYLARRRGTDRVVALKVLRPDVSVDANLREGFSRECRNLRQLSHPHILSITDTGGAGRDLYLAAPFHPFGTVFDAVERHGPLPLGPAVAITGQLLDALDHAHSAQVRHTDGSTVTGLVHRDVTPRQLLLTGRSPRWSVTLADFGLAKAFELAGLSGYTHSGAMGGTFEFMARPQVIDFKYARPEVDVWAAAACLYWMLTGTTPRHFPPGADPVAVVLRTKPIPIRDRSPDLPPALAEAVDTALIDEPAITVTTARHLATALSEAVATMGAEHG